MSRSPDQVTLAVVQMHVTDNLDDNVTRAMGHVRDAAGQGAQRPVGLRHHVDEAFASAEDHQ